MTTALTIQDETTSGERGQSLTLHLPEPTITARRLQVREQRKLDWHAQSRAALEAFGRNGFLLLVDERQIESLDEEIRVRPETRVTFLKLVPLVGG